MGILAKCQSDAYWILRKEEYIDRLGVANFIIMLDLGPFWQCPLQFSYSGKGKKGEGSLKGSETDRVSFS